MIKHLQDTYTLNNGVSMPGFGLGVYKVEDHDTVVHSVKTAINHGYRSIDTASFYNNETGVGEAIRAVDVPRDEIFITSKVWNDQQGYEETLAAFETSLQNLGLEYLDLYLIHWPVKGKFTETWRTLEKLYKERKVRAIGVSNFHVQHLNELLEDANIVPAINQVEYHPHLNQSELKTYCEDKGIQLEAWSPLKRGQLLNEPALVELGNKYGKTAAQIILRWDIQSDVITIPKSTHEARIKENANIFDFSLTDIEMNQINQLNMDDRVGTNPDKFN